MARWLEGRDFRQGLTEDERIAKVLSAEELAACFDVQRMLGNVDVIYKRFGL